MFLFLQHRQVRGGPNAVRKTHLALLWMLLCITTMFANFLCLSYWLLCIQYSWMTACYKQNNRIHHHSSFPFLMFWVSCSPFFSFLHSFNFIFFFLISCELQASLIALVCLSFSVLMNSNDRPALSCFLQLEEAITAILTVLLMPLLLFHPSSKHLSLIIFWSEDVKDLLRTAVYECLESRW